MCCINTDIILLVSALIYIPLLHSYLLNTLFLLFRIIVSTENDLCVLLFIFKMIAVTRINYLYFLSLVIYCNKW